jgi:hypothetical protein
VPAYPHAASAARPVFESPPCRWSGGGDDVFLVLVVVMLVGGMGGWSGGAAEVRAGLLRRLDGLVAECQVGACTPVLAAALVAAEAQ